MLFTDSGGSNHDNDVIKANPFSKFSPSFARVSFDDVIFMVRPTDVSEYSKESLWILIKMVFSILSQR